MPDGFEGNAQSFRVVTKVSVRSNGFPGLNLTGATLRAILKYPETRQTGGGNAQWKFGAYHTEEEDFNFAMKVFPGDSRRSAEAELMDWADDITYAVHDVEDFYRAGLIPLDRLIWDRKESESFVKSVFERWKEQNRTLEYPMAKYKDAFLGVLAWFRDTLPRSYSLTEPYSGTSVQRAALHKLASQLITRYVDAIHLLKPVRSKPLVERQEVAEKEVIMLKELTWHYVINRPSLATMQHGQRRVIRDLFEIYYKAVTSNNRTILPRGYMDQLEGEEADAGSDRERTMTVRTRLVADIIAGMSDQQAFQMHQRLTGISAGSIMDAMVR